MKFVYVGLIIFLTSCTNLIDSSCIYANQMKRQISNTDPTFAASRNSIIVTPIVNPSLQSTGNARFIDTVSTAAIDATIDVSKKLNNNSLRQGFFNTLKAPKDLCPFKNVAQCDPNSRFRTFEGSCNNLVNPWWGKSETPYKRYIKPAYDDGIGAPRQLAKSGRLLPNPRSISAHIGTDNSLVEQFDTHILTLFGQFLAHEMTSASISADASGATINCPCGVPNPSCMSIQIPPNDKVLSMSCMKFTRSSAAFSTFDCSLGQLRSTPRQNSRPYLPQVTDPTCTDTDQLIKCFAAGEGRTNENLGLVSIHTLFMRLHNQIAAKLAILQPSWSDEELYQQTRRIVLSVYQHITYNEFVPTVIGFNAAKLFEILPLKTKTYFNGYDQNVNPSIANDFAAAAFRYGHTTVRNQFSRRNINNQQTSTVNLRDTIFRPVEAYNEQEGGLDSILFGLINDESGKFDTSFADTLQNHLFEFPAGDGTFIAVDLIAANINRGRDHGLASYNSYRELCGFARAQKFDDLVDIISRENINKLAQLYENVDDVDLYVGGLSETPLAGAVVGPVFACIIGNQFSDLKRGDRFYYENGPSNTALTLAQLNEIRKTTFASIICDNTDLTSIQPSVFLQPLESLGNQRVPCSSIPSLDLRPWAVSQ